MPTYAAGESGERLDFSGDAPEELISVYEQPDSIICGTEEIQNENARMTKAAKLMDLLATEDTITAAALKKLLSSVKSAAPNLPIYKADKSSLSKDDYNALTENAAIEPGDEDIKISLGIVTSRANMRCLPTDEALYTSNQLKYDMNQETELILGQGVIIYGKSVDEKFYFVSCYNYTGWVNAEKIAITEDRNLWESFIKPSSFITFTACLTEISGEKADMGVILPLEDLDDAGFTVTLPVRNDDGTLSAKSATVSKDSAHVGYVPYTAANFIIQACKYEGRSYGWGGLDDNVDCSGFLCAVLRSFGFYIPRDTGDQEKVVGVSNSVKNSSRTETARLLDEAATPAAVYSSGHVMLYMGKNTNGQFVLIHAYSVDSPITITAVSSLDGIRYVDYILARE